MELRTPRLLLRELRLADLDAVQAYASDPEVTRYMSWGPNTPEDTRAFLAFVTRAAVARPRSVYELGVVELEKLGFTREGHLRENVKVRSEWRDTIVFSILDREWSQRHGRSSRRNR